MPAAPTSTTRLHASARAKAVRRLMDAHPDEYRRLYGEECRALGITDPAVERALATLRAAGYEVPA